MTTRLAALFGLALIVFALAGCSSPFAYPHFWDYTTSQPAESAVVGMYRIRDVRLANDLANSVRVKPVHIALLADHSAVLENLPEFDGSGDAIACKVSKPTAWKLSDYEGSYWGVVFAGDRREAKQTTPNCGEGSISIEMLGSRAPYRLYMTVGDPDSDTGIEFERIPD